MNSLRKYLREKEGETTKTKNMEERQDYLARNGYSLPGIDRVREGYVNVVKTLKKRRPGSVKTNAMQQNKERKF